MTKPNDEQQLEPCPEKMKNTLETIKDILQKSGMPDKDYLIVKDLIDIALKSTRHPSPRAGLSVEEIRSLIEKNATHILHYHDKEGGRISKEIVIHLARFKEIAQAIHDAQPKDLSNTCLHADVGFPCCPNCTQPKDDGLVDLKKRILDRLVISEGFSPGPLFNAGLSSAVDGCRKIVEEEFSHHEKRKL